MLNYSFYCLFDCSELCDLDHRQFKKDTEMVLSSELIMDKYGGQEGIMKALYTDQNVSFTHTYH